MREASPKMKQARDKLKFISKLCSAMYKEAKIKRHWITSENSGARPFYKFMKANMLLNINAFNIAEAAIVCSIQEIEAELMEAAYEPDKLKLRIRLKEIPASVSKNFNPEISVQGFMMLSSPLGEMKEPLEFIPLSSVHTGFLPDEVMEFQIPLIGTNLNLFRCYKDKQFVVSLFLEDTLGNTACYSKNIYGGLE